MPLLCQNFSDWPLQIKINAASVERISNLVKDRP